MAITLNKKKHELIDILDDFMTNCKYRDLILHKSIFI